MTRTARRLVPLATAMALVLPSLILPARASAQVALDAEERATMEALNEIRADAGLAPFTLSPILTRAAEFMVDDNAGRDTLDHIDRHGRTLPERLRAFGYPSNTWLRENLGSGHEAGAAAVRQWVDSAPHLANILAPDVVTAGIARVYREGTRFGWFWALVMGSHEDSGTMPLGASAPRPAPPVPTGTTPGTFATQFPATGVGLNVWNGGTVEQLTAAVAAGGARSVFVTQAGSFVGYIVGAPAFVNAEFLDAFPGGEAPAGTPIVVVR